MVTFTCHNCGDSVKKPKVDKHINNECKKRKYGHAKLCCIDCLNDFDAESYVKHTSCISEAERYSAPGFVAKQSSNKGVRKQNSWIEVLNSVSNRSDLTGSQRQLLNAIKEFENVPRKKNKFQNFIKSSVRHIRVNPQTVDQLYDLLEQAFKSTSDQNTTNGKKTDQTMSNSNTNGLSESSHTEAVEPQNEKKKRKLESSHDAPLSDNGGENELTNVPNGTKKKKKKRKHDGDSENQNNETDAAEPQSAVDTANDDSSNVPVECDERTQKKKKKREHVDEVENSNEDTAVNTVDIEDNDSSTLNNDHSEKKRKKKKKREKSDSSEVPNGGDSLLDTCNVENENSTEKKKKKSSHKTNGDLSEISEQTIESTEQPVKTKSKKPKIANVDEATTTITENGNTVEEPESETQANKEDKELRKKNKKKKKQNGDLDVTEPSKLDDDMAVDNSIVGEDEEKAEAEIISKSSKKNKKRKHEEASTEVIPQSEELQTDGLENGSSRKKKKKKSKTE